MTKQENLAQRLAEAASSADRVAGYCGLAHRNGGAHCTRPPGHSGAHVDHYNGRQSIADSVGTTWSE